MTGHGATVAEQEQGQPDDGAAGPCECDVVIRHGYIITMNPDRAVYADGAVAVFGREIVMVGTDQYYAAWYHVMSPEDEHAGAQISGLELLRSGVTCFMEPGTAFDTDAVADAVVGVGIRASLSEPFLWDISEDPMLGSMRRSPGTAQRCGELLGRELWRNAADGLVRGHVSPFGSGTASDGLVRDACDLAKSSCVIFTQHQSSTLHGIRGQEAWMGEMPLVHYGKLGLLRPHCSFAHMTRIRREEARFVRESGMSIIWSPAISMNWGWAKGCTRSHPRLFRDGVTVGLGSDVPKFGVDTAAMIAYLLARTWQARRCRRAHHRAAGVPARALPGPEPAAGKPWQVSRHGAGRGTGGDPLRPLRPGGRAGGLPRRPRVGRPPGRADRDRSEQQLAGRGRP